MHKELRRLDQSPAIRIFLRVVLVVGLLNGLMNLGGEHGGGLPFSPTVTVQAAEEGPANKEAKKVADPTPAAPVATGNVEGQVLFDGDVPDAKFIIPPGGAVPGGPGGVIVPFGVLDEELLVNTKTKGIANVFVYLQKAPAGFKQVVPAAAVGFDQNGFQFVPHALIVQTGQKIEFINRDPVLANTHFFPARNPGINRAAPPAGPKPMAIPMQLARPERLPVMVRSDLQPWMRAYVLPLDHPFCTVTDGAGKFSIPSLPVGTHKFVVWHERASFLERNLSVTVTAGKVTKVPLKYPEMKFDPKP